MPIHNISRRLFLNPNSFGWKFNNPYLLGLSQYECHFHPQCNLISCKLTENCNRSCLKKFRLKKRRKRRLCKRSHQPKSPPSQSTTSSCAASAINNSTPQPTSPETSNAVIQSASKQQKNFSNTKNIL